MNTTPKSSLIIPMQPVKSSNISELGYDETSGELRVRFASGGLFSYEGVSKALFDGLRTANSIGKHFGTHIRPKFKGKRL